MFKCEFRKYKIEKYNIYADETNNGYAEFELRPTMYDRGADYINSMIITVKKDSDLATDLFEAIKQSAESSYVSCKVNVDDKDHPILENIRFMIADKDAHDPDAFGIIDMRDYDENGQVIE